MYMYMFMCVVPYTTGLMKIEHKIFVLGPEESILLLDDGQVKIFQGNPERNSSIFLGEAKAFVTF